jgi:caffeoyl-CoA O-methyltransferase
MEFLDPDLNLYSELHTSPEPAVLKELNRETNVKVLMPRMLSGHLQGRALSMLSHMIQPSRILEIGTYTGYSAICLAEGLREDGMLHTIDINEELAEMVSKYILMARMTDRITTYTGNALEIIPQLDISFDLVFIDADKINYSAYYDLVLPRLRKGGYIIADNVLWSGKVTGEYDSLDEDTRALVDFNRKVQEDERVENVLFPVRDGLMVARKL